MSIGKCGILSMIHTQFYPDLKREKSINVASFLYRGRVWYTNGVFIIDSIPHCTSGLETSKGHQSRNVASFLYRERVENTNGVFIIDSIPHCPSGLKLCQ